MKNAIFKQSDFLSLPNDLDKTIYSVMAADIANKKTAELATKVVSLLNVLNELDGYVKRDDLGYEYHEDLKTRNKLMAELEVFIVNGGVRPEFKEAEL